MAAASVKGHPSYRQVMMDVDRCAGRLEQIRQVYLHKTEEEEYDPPGESCKRKFNHDGADDDYEDEDKSEKPNEEDEQSDEESKNHKKAKETLASLIVKLLIRNPDLHYYQGFHDVCLTYMILVGKMEAFKILNQLIKTHFDLFMRPTMHQTEELLALVPILIGLRDSKLRDFLEKAQVGTIFSLSWIITWFSHVITNEKDLEIIFKFLEKQDPHMILYLCAEVVIFKKDKILELEPEMSTVHHYLCRIPRKEKLPIDSLISKASEAFSRWPPVVLKQKLDRYRKSNLQLRNLSILRSRANRFASVLDRKNAKTAILVLALASACLYGYDRWMKF